MEIVEKLLTTYWNQLTLLLLGIGYLLKRIIDTKSNKKEISFRLFQEQRIKALGDFFYSYAKTERMFKDLPIYPILRYEMTTKEIDEFIFKPLNELRSNVLILQIYFKEIDHGFFNKILSNCIEINSKLSSLYFKYNEEDIIIDKANEFSFFSNLKLSENEKILKNITRIAKNTFNN